MRCLLLDKGYYTFCTFHAKDFSLLALAVVINSQADQVNTHWPDEFCAVTEEV